MTLRSLVFVVASLFVAAAASADNGNLIVNGDFETSNVGFGGGMYSNGFTNDVAEAAPWTFTNGGGILNHNTGWGGGAATSSVAFLQDYQPFGWLPPQLSQTFASNADTFAISFTAAQRPGYSEGLNVTIDGVAANDAVLVPADAEWTTYSFNVSGLSGGVHTLTFNGVNYNDASDASLFLDNVSVVAVPEPETYGMLLAGLGLLGFMARRRSPAKAA